MIAVSVYESKKMYKETRERGRASTSSFTPDPGENKDIDEHVERNSLGQLRWPGNVWAHRLEGAPNTSVHIGRKRHSEMQHIMARGREDYRKVVTIKGEVTKDLTALLKHRFIKKD